MATPQKHPRLRRLAFRASAVLIGVLLGAAIAELSLRLFNIRPERYPPLRWLAQRDGRFEPMLHWKDVFKRPTRLRGRGIEKGEHIPGAVVRVEYADNPRNYFDEQNGVTYRINSQGMNGPETTKEKPPGTFRILGLGDSFTFGQGVWERDTYLRRLEADLNRQHVIPEKVEVLNAGELGYNTRDEVAYFEHVWIDYDPDLVLIGFYLNDAYSDDTFLNHGQTLGIYLNPSPLASSSYLADFVEHKYKVWRLQRDIEHYYHDLYFARADTLLNNPGQKQVDWTVSRAALERAAELCRQRKIGIALIIFPEFYGMNGEYPFENIHALVRNAAEQIGLPTLDLLNVYRGMQDNALWVHATDHHPNELAHRLAAEAIERFLVERGLLNKHRRDHADVTSN